MPSDQLITVQVGSSALDKDGTPLGKNFSFSFQTAPFGIQYSSPRNAELFVNSATQIVMSFNSYVIRSSVESAFSISPAVSGSFAYGGYASESRNQVVFSLFTVGDFIAPESISPYIAALIRE